MAELDVEPTSQTVNGFHPPNARDQDSPNPPDVLGYLENLLTITLGATHDDLHARNSLLSSDQRPETIERCVSFLQSYRVGLYAQKRERNGIEVNGVNGEHGRLQSGF